MLVQLFFCQRSCGRHRRRRCRAAVFIDYSTDRLFKMQATQSCFIATLFIYLFLLMLLLLFFLQFVCLLSAWFCAMQFVTWLLLLLLFCLRLISTPVYFCCCCFLYCFCFNLNAFLAFLGVGWWWWCCCGVFLFALILLPTESWCTSWILFPKRTDYAIQRTYRGKASQSVGGTIRHIIPTFVTN